MRGPTPDEHVPFRGGVERAWLLLRSAALREKGKEQRQSLSRPPSSVPSLSPEIVDWFGCEWQVTAGELGTSSHYSPDTGAEVSVRPDGVGYFVFERLLMVWPWAMYFVQSSMSEPMREALPITDACGGLATEGSPAPKFGPGSAVGSAYIDNGAVIGPTYHDTVKALSRMRESLQQRGLIVDEYLLPTKKGVVVGLEFDMKRREVRRKPCRIRHVNRVMRALLRMGGCTPHALEILLGHLVAYFMIHREGSLSSAACIPAYGDTLTMPTTASPALWSES